MSNIPFNQRVSCTISEAISATGIGRSKLYEEMRDGRVETIKIGTRTLISVPSLLKRFSPQDPAQQHPQPVAA